MKNGTIKRIIILIVFCIIMLANDNSVEAKDRKVEAIRIKEIKQDIDGREVYIKCGVKDCPASHNKKFIDKPCEGGSDLRHIYEKTKKGKWRTLEQFKFKNMQGGCINGDKMIIAFVDKDRHKKGDLTAFVEIDLVKNKVIKVTMVQGAKDLNIKAFGHSNDFTYLNGKYYGSWYQKNGKKNYTSRIGRINTKLSGNGTSSDFSKDSKGKAAFGITSYIKDDQLALGIRENVNEGKSSHLERYVSVCSVKNTKKGKAKYKLEKKIFKLKKNKKFSTSQCMEQSNGKFYLVRFNKKEGKDNNCIEVINKNGNKEKQYIIKNPKRISIYSNDGKKEIFKFRKIKWEIESLAHYKKKTFYYTMYKPSDDNVGKQAYLYKVKLK